MGKIDVRRLPLEDAVACAEKRLPEIVDEIDRLEDELFICRTLVTLKSCLARLAASATGVQK